MHVLFAAIFVGLGSFHLARSARAYRTGRLVWRFWLRRRITCREEDTTGFKSALALQTAAGFGFLALATIALLS